MKLSLTISFLGDQLTITHSSSPEHPTTLDLEPHTIYNGTIFKPSKLVTKLSAHLQSIKLKNPTATVCLPIIMHTSATMLPFIVLQYTLVLAKTGIQITKVTSEDPQTANFLTLLRPTGTKTPKFWLFVTLITIGTLGTTMWTKHHDAINHYKTLIDQATIGKQTNTDYEKQYRETNALKTTIKQLQEKYTATQDLLQKRYSPVHVLTTIANKTPASLWLTSVTFNKRNTEKPPRPLNTQITAKNPKDFDITLNGTSLDTKAISQLLKNLGHKTSGINHPTLVNVSKEKRGPKTQAPKTLYHFVIAGTVKPGL